MSKQKQLKKMTMVNERRDNAKTLRLARSTTKRQMTRHKHQQNSEHGNYSKHEVKWLGNMVNRSD